MHPFGGSPICPTCSKAVYAAEQVMGPGRKLYHKACLKCTCCNKRLDSFSLLEHDEQPYCKICHVKLFATRDLRHANLPHRDDLARVGPGHVLSASPGRVASPSTAPARSLTTEGGIAQPQPQPVRRHITGNGGMSGLLRPTRTLSPAKGLGAGALDGLVEDALDENGNGNGNGTEDVDGIEGLGSNANGDGPRTRTPPLRANGAAPTTPTTPGAAPRHLGGRYVATVPLVPSMTGTRYGAALGGFSASPRAMNVNVNVNENAGTRAGTTPGRPSPSPATPSQSPWGGGTTPKCARCAKAVYFAEQVKAVGKTWHRACLRCGGCGHTLDSGRVVDREGVPFCQRCYGKMFGPAGQGYALLGKAGS